MRLRIELQLWQIAHSLSPAADLRAEEHGAGSGPAARLALRHDRAPDRIGTGGGAAFGTRTYLTPTSFRSEREPGPARVLWLASVKWTGIKRPRYPFARAAHDLPRGR
jgi:hypothetical protein